MQVTTLRFETPGIAGSLRCLAAAVALFVVAIPTKSCLAVQANSRSDDVKILNGVVAKFRVINSTIRPSEPLKVSLTLRNASTEAVSFRFVGPLAPNVRVYNSARHRLSFRAGASLGEYPAATVDLQPGEEFKTTLIGTLGDYYKLQPGKYYLQFIYDLRLITDSRLAEKYMEKYQSHSVIPWDSQLYRFSVVRGNSERNE